MTALTEMAAERHLAARAFHPSWPGFIGLSLDVPVPVEPRPLRHGFIRTRFPGVTAISGPPSPGLQVALDRMTDDLAEAGLAAGPAGVRVALEAGTDEPGLFGLRRRWRVAHAIAPVMAAAFANDPVIDGEQAGWRSISQARRSQLPPMDVAADPRTAWARQVLDAPVRADAPTTFRQWIRAGQDGSPALPDLDEHVLRFRPAVAAHGHLLIDVVDAQPAGCWATPAAVIATLIDDPVAASEALAATERLHHSPDLWERVGRDALTDGRLATSARSLFVSAYAALSRRGAPRRLRDDIAAFFDRYASRGRCPADDFLEAHAAELPQ